MKAARISRGARRRAAGRDEQRELVGQLARAERDLSLAEYPDVAGHEADRGRSEHVPCEREVDGAFLEPLVAEDREIERSGHSAQHGKVVELAVPDLGVPPTGHALARAGEGCLGLEPAAQAPTAERGHERLRAAVAQREGDVVARRPGQAHGRLALERAVRQLPADRGERDVSARELERGGELSDLDALRESGATRS